MNSVNIKVVSNVKNSVWVDITYNIRFNVIDNVWNIIKGNILVNIDLNNLK
jgi:hypothetical protein